MAKKTIKQESPVEDNFVITNKETIRWTLGLTLFGVGLFSVVSVLFYLVDWKADFSILNGVNSDSPLFDEAQISNPCGRMGAWIGELLVGRSFGVVGVVIPLFLTIIGVRILRSEPLKINRTLLGASLILILGSLSFGFLFSGFEIFNSGLGGNFGLSLSHALCDVVGGVGCAIILLGGWILTGVFINRNFIRTVNSAGNVAVDRGEKLVDMVKNSVKPRTQTLNEDVAKESVEDRENQTTSSTSEPNPIYKPASNLNSNPVERSEPSSEPSSELSSEIVSESAPTIEPKAEIEPEFDPTPTYKENIEEESKEEEISKEVIAKESVNPTLEKDEEDIDDLDEPSPFIVLTDDTIVGAGDTINTIYSRRRRSEGLELVEIDDNGEIVESETTEPMEVIRTVQEPVIEDLSDDIEELTDIDDIEELTTDPEPIFEVAPQTESSLSQPQIYEDGVVITVEANEAELVDEDDVDSSLYDPLMDLNHYERPPFNLLEDYNSDFEVSDAEIYENKAKIEDTLKHFGIPISRIKATVGPTITLYEIVQAQGVKISKIQGLENDIAQSLKALGIRIIAPIPGRGTIGIEVPNRHTQIVSMYSAVRSTKFQEIKAQLPIVIGRTIQNENYVFDLAKMPHLLVAGATGQGKSVGLNAIITSLLYRKHPAELKLVMIDPKMVEFTPYKHLERHFMAKMESEDDVIITDPKKAVYTLNSLCEEMEKRLKLLSAATVRNIVEYNEKFKNRRLNPENGHFYMPYIVVVVDEFADLIMMTREVEAPVMRLAQKARAVGIHLIIATQRPDVKVITGGIKANFPARIAFRVMQMIDSRTIIDQPGANQLIGRGDMLFSKDGELTRIQCALVETDEVERVVNHISCQQGYTEAYRLPDYTPEGGGDVDLGSDSGAAIKYDSLFAEIARTAVAGGTLSTSYIQRNFEVGFNRAGRIMTQLERAGIVGRQEGAKPREILFHDSLSLEEKLQSLGVG
ncbi:MAG: DNA translocase FtsK [Rikenellaceae bacterium]